MLLHMMYMSFSMFRDIFVYISEIVGLETGRRGTRWHHGGDLQCRCVSGASAKVAPYDGYEWDKRPYTPLKTNMSPENRWLEDVFPTEMVTF